MVTANLRRLVEKSRILASRKDCEKVQVAYTLHCIPQIYGAVIDTIRHAREK